jgi:hexosaminidase
MNILPVVLAATPLYTLVGQSFSPSDVSIIPQPAMLVRDAGTFRLRAGRVAVPRGFPRIRQAISTLIDPGFTATGGDSKHPVITFAIDKSWKHPEGYRLKVGRDRITILGADEAGAFYGIQTLRQLLPVEAFSNKPRAGVSWTVPCCRIEDYPRFAWRGMMLDCSRHFFPKTFIERFVDLLAMQKMNTFHWHLTDDQGWRIEIKRYPKLTSVGGFRKETIIGGPSDNPANDQYDHTPYGGFYTQADIREIVRYAQDRFVRIVPEIELPGHSAAALAAYPELATHPPVEVWTSWGVNPNTINLEESTFKFYENVLAEVFRLFPSPYVHLGGDEAPTTQWAASAEIQMRMRELGIPSIDRVQPYITARMAHFLASKGKRMVGWDEILNGELPQNVVVMSWRGTSGGETASKSGHDVVMAPSSPVYFGPRLQMDRVYDYDPCPPLFSADQASHVLGAQGEIWAEHELTPANVEYAAFPNSCALAEVDWTPQGSRNYASFLGRLKVHLERLRALGVNVHMP